MDVNVWDLVSQVIESKRDPLDLLREHLSNICAKEVDAHNVRVVFYIDPTYGPSFVFTDDGIGMDYTGNMAQPGRLDRFLAVSYGGHAGYSSDEFGHKGLGAKLSLNCKRLEIKTKSRATGQSYFVYVDAPLDELRQNRQPKYQLVPGACASQIGTEVKVLGYERGEGRGNYDFDHVKRYMLFSTIVGHTRQRAMPVTKLKINDHEETLQTGFPFLQVGQQGDWKTYTLSKPIEKAETVGNVKVAVSLKGGFTLNTADQQITGPFTLTPKTAGLWLSLRGIPYIRLDFNSFRGEFSTLQYKFCRFVVESDALFDQMDFARGSYQSEGVIGTAFEKLVRACFNELNQHPQWKVFQRELERQRQMKSRETLDERKNRLLSPQQKYVFLKSNGKILHREPGNEHDTLALMWKMEGANAFPIPHFESLEHTAMEGIDVLANFRLRPDGDTQTMVPVEVEDTFEEFIGHGHNPNQTGAIVCWRVDDPDDSALEQSDLHYLMFYKAGDRKLPVLILSRFPTIEVRAKI